MGKRHQRPSHRIEKLLLETLVLEGGDVNLIQVGGVSSLDATFRSGRIDAFLLSPPLPQTLEQVGISVVQAFEGLKAKVTLAARNPSQLARAWAMNTRSIHLRELTGEIGQFPLIVNSTTSLVLARYLLERTHENVVIIDLCSPPGGVEGSRESVGTIRSRSNVFNDLQPY